MSQIQAPSTFKEAIESSQKSEWIQAMKSEVKSLMENETWALVNLPKGTKTLSGRWVFRIKTNLNKSQASCKRLYAKERRRL